MLGKKHVTDLARLLDKELGLKLGRSESRNRRWKLFQQIPSLNQHLRRGREQKLDHNSLSWLDRISIIPYLDLFDEKSPRKIKHQYLHQFLLMHRNLGMSQ